MITAAGVTALACDLSWISPRLAVSGCLPEEAELRAIVEQGVGAVIDCRSEERDELRPLQRLGIDLLHLPADDGDAFDLDQIDEGVAWVWHQWGRSRRVLVHCAHGIGRSPLLACCVLVSEGDDPLDALERAKDAREIVSLSPSQLRAYREWSRRFHERSGAAWTVPPPQALERIAWRHLLPFLED